MLGRGKLKYLGHKHKLEGNDHYAATRIIDGSTGRVILQVVKQPVMHDGT
jgi:hypothetical protein